MILHRHTKIYTFRQINKDVNQEKKLIKFKMFKKINENKMCSKTEKIQCVFRY